MNRSLPLEAELRNNRSGTSYVVSVCVDVVSALAGGVPSVFRTSAANRRPGDMVPQDGAGAVQPGKLLPNLLRSPVSCWCLLLAVWSAVPCCWTLLAVGVRVLFCCAVSTFQKNRTATLPFLWRSPAATLCSCNGTNASCLSVVCCRLGYPMIIMIIIVIIIIVIIIVLYMHTAACGPRDKHAQESHR